jgi:hypothetical protein
MLLVAVVAYALLAAFTIIALVTDHSGAVGPATILGWPWSRVAPKVFGLNDHTTALTSVALSLPMLVNLVILVCLYRVIDRNQGMNQSRNQSRNQRNQ